MENPIKAVYAWQEKAGNLEQRYDDYVESSYQVEEALEGFNLALLANELEEESIVAKDVSRKILELATTHIDVFPQNELSDVDRLDKAIDSIVFAIGSMGKLGLSSQQIQQAILVVNHANIQKLNMHRDEYGKLLKPENFVGPEVELQKILDKRV